ncbi:ribokinase [Brachybacterium squillarum]|uniref:ribokinase n=1 Tax=Brachybacterium squillarum TaxID=661979 RepID=UPI000262A024|nr:ribokinase [Brachybacterium squillarum]
MPASSADDAPAVPSHAPDAGIVVVLGSLNVDLQLAVPRHPRPGETVLVRGTGSGIATDASTNSRAGAPDPRRSPGGKGANQALAASRAGARVAMIGAVGDDVDATVALSLLREDGVDMSGVATTRGPTGLAVVAVDPGGENTIIVDPGANASVVAAAVRAHAEVLAEAAVVVLQGEIPRVGIEKAARLTRGRLVLNPAPVLELDAEVLRRADPLVVNEHEAAAMLPLLGVAPPDSAETEQDDDPTEAEEALARALHAAGVCSVVLTLGGRGSLSVDATGVHRQGVADVDPVDTTGAGDAFIGALAAHLAAGVALSEAAAQAARMAGASVAAAGAQASYPARGATLPPLLPR